MVCLTIFQSGMCYDNMIQFCQRHLLRWQFFSQEHTRAWQYKNSLTHIAFFINEGGMPQVMEQSFFNLPKTCPECIANGFFVLLPPQLFKIVRSLFKEPVAISFQLFQVLFLSMWLLGHRNIDYAPKCCDLHTHIQVSEKI